LFKIKKLKTDYEKEVEENHLEQEKRFLKI